MNILDNLLGNLPLLLGSIGGTAGDAPAGSGSILTMLLPFGLIILVFYFLIIRPQSKKSKETKAMLSSLRKNDRVATIGGIRGTITAVKEDTVIVKVSDSIKMEFSKSAISNVLERKESSKKEKQPPTDKEKDEKKDDSTDSTGQ